MIATLNNRVNKFFSICVLLLFCNSCGVQKIEQPTIETTSIASPLISNNVSITTIPAITLTVTKQISLYQRLSPGRYIVYETREDKDFPNYPLYVISETGIEQGKLVLGEQYYPVISPDNKKIAYSTMSEVKVLFLENDSTISLPDRMNCFHGTSELAWGPDSEMLAINCGSVVIVKIPSGDIIGIITNKIFPNIDQTSFNITWSPDGKWMAYYLHFISQLEGNKGPYVTEASCMMNEDTCQSKSKVFPYTNDKPITWTPSSNFAILDTSEEKIKIYNPNTSSLLKTVVIPDTGYYLDSFAWSPDEEWVVVGGGFGPGLYLFSIETGEFRTLMKKGGFPKFWLTIP
jgi:Tol biopolymer transport system component